MDGRLSHDGIRTGRVVATEGVGQLLTHAVQRANRSTAWSAGEMHVARAPRRFEILDDSFGLCIDNDHAIGPLAADEEQPGVRGESARG
jgi:hypothetical protein